MLAALIGALNSGVLADMQAMARQFSRDDRRRFVRRYPWPQDSRYVLVTYGTPNGSYGYFYLGAAVVLKEQAPEEIRPDADAAKARAESEARQREAQATRAELERRYREGLKQERARAKARVAQGHASAVQAVSLRTRIHALSFMVGEPHTHTPEGVVYCGLTSTAGRYFARYCIDRTFREEALRLLRVIHPTPPARTAMV